VGHALSDAYLVFVGARPRPNSRLAIDGGARHENGGLGIDSLLVFSSSVGARDGARRLIVLLNCGNAISYGNSRR
jgi:hypothetical protein